MAFAAEAHLSRDRRLIIDASGLVMEWQTGIQSSVRWGQCEAVLAWPDRIELVLGDQTSLVVRASQWHRGSQALDAIRARAPRSLLVPMPHDPEPQPEMYVLRGLATSPGSVLWVLLLLATVVAAMGLDIGVSEGRTSGVLVGAAFALGGAFVVRAMVVRFRVPSRWRIAAVARGRLGVGLESTAAAASGRGLVIAAIATVLIAVALETLWIIQWRMPNGWLLGLALAVLGVIARENRRRRARLGARGRDTQGPPSI